MTFSERFRRLVEQADQLAGVKWGSIEPLERGIACGWVGQLAKDACDLHRDLLADLNVEGEGER